jgi:hypothetical protein
MAASLCYDANMTKVRTTVTLSEDVARWVKVRAARAGKGDSEIIEESLRRDLGMDAFERLWRRNSDVDEGTAMETALEAQRWTRRGAGPRARRK